MRRLLRFLRSGRAANGIEYAALIGLIAVVSIGAVAAGGDKVRAMLGDAANLVMADADGPTGGTGASDGSGPPTITVASDRTTLRFGETATVSWDSDGATTVSAASTIVGGACTTRSGDGPHALDAAGLDGGLDFPWDADDAGCSFEICVTAANAEASADDCVTIDVVARDATPDAIAFAAVDAPAGLEVVSESRTLSGFDGPLPVSVSAGATFRLNGAGLWVTDGTAQAGDDIALRVTAPETAGSETDVVLTVGGMIATWTVKSVNTVAVFAVHGQHDFTVPYGVTAITVKAWGAGGGGGFGRAQSAVGGGGGFASSTLSVTPGQKLTVLVGEGGKYDGRSPTTGGGGSIGPNGFSGSGGGRSAVRFGGEDLVTAGGGGGAGYDGNGGAGGGLEGGKADNAGIPAYCANVGNDINGGGGTQTSGGQPGASYCDNDPIHRGEPGSKYTGGNGGIGFKAEASYGGSGGGGGGWYGGAGGNYNGYAGGGGGGSSHGDNTIAGSGAQPGNAADADYNGTAGIGGGSRGNGSDGLVVIRW